MAMARKPHVLFLFFEGLAETVIDSQVLAHIRSVADAGIATFEIACAPWQREVVELSLKRRTDAEERAGCRILILQGERPSRVGSASENARRILKAISPDAARFSHIHARTDYSALVGSALRPHLNAHLIWDCRGDAAAELDYRKDLQNGLKALALPAVRMVLARRMRAAAQVCDRALFVSHPLRELVRRDLGDKPFSIVPSCASPKMFFFDPELRSAMRERLGVEGDRFVVAYCGGLQPYQRFDDSIEAFRQFSDGSPRAVFLAATPQLAEAEQILRARLSEGSWIARKASLQEVNGFLNAADAGFLLRHDTPTNHSASPTKFAEYCLAGLRVIMTNAVRDSHQLALELGNCIEFDERNRRFTVQPSPARREQIALQAGKVLAKDVYLPAYRTIYAP